MSVQLKHEPRGVCRDFMVRKCSEEVIRGGPALLSVGVLTSLSARERAGDFLFYDGTLNQETE